MKKALFILLKIIQYSAFIVMVFASTMIDSPQKNMILIVSLVIGLGLFVFDLWRNNGKATDDGISSETDRKFL